MIQKLDCAHKEMVLQYIMDHEIELVMIYGNVITCGLENQPGIRRCADYYGYFDEGALKGLIAFYNLGSCIPHYTDPKAIPEFAKLMKERSFDVALGMTYIIKPLTDHLQAEKPHSYIDEEMYMVNSAFQPYENGALELHDADASDEEQMAFCARIRKECFDENTTVQEQRDIVMQKNKEEDYLIAYEVGKPIAQAVVHGYTPQYGQIGAVGTLPEFRNRGASKRVVSGLCQRIISKGRIPTLFVRLNNAPAVKVYQSLGFKRLDDYQMVWYENGTV